jgi:hypothetical protein
MKKLLILLILLNPIASFGQDLIPTSSGDIKVTPILHGTVVLEFQGKLSMSILMEGHQFLMVKRNLT